MWTEGEALGVAGGWALWRPARGGDGVEEGVRERERESRELGVAREAN